MGMNIHNMYRSASDELLSAAQAAKLLPSTSASTVSRWARRGEIPFVELPGGRRFFRRSDIEALLTPVVASAASADDVSSPVFDRVAGE